MTKKELLDTPEIRQTDKIKKALAERVERYNGAMENKYQMALRVAKIQGEEIYKVAVFSENMTRAYIFLDVSNDRYYTYDLTAQKWRTAMIESLFFVGWYPTKGFYSSSSTDGILKNVLKAKGKEGWEIISNWQQGITDRIREKKKQKERDRVNGIMSSIKPLPNHFDEWANRQGDQFIFYDYSRNVKEGWCSCCRAMVPIKKPKHRKESSCRKCGRHITFICNSRKNEVWTRCISIHLLQNYGNGIVDRRFSMSKKVRMGTADISILEMDREIIEPTGSTLFNWDRGEWKQAQLAEHDYYYSYGQKIYQYFDHTDKGMKKLKTSYMLTDRSVPAWIYISSEKRKPVIEKCAKAGLTRLANEFITRHEAYYVVSGMKNGELAKDLGIDNMRMKRLKEAKGGWDLLAWYQEEKQANTIWDDDILFRFSVWKIEPDDMSEILSHVSMTKAYNYILKQSKLDNASVTQTLQTYNDYMFMALRLKMDTDKSMVYMPKDLRKAHNECIDLLDKKRVEDEAKKLKKKWPKVEKNLKGLERYEWTDGKYCIVSPKTIADIYREGMLLKHCLHTCDIYWDRITTKTTFLMFLRKAEEPDNPWYTLEVEPGGNIRQKRTMGDNQNPDLEDAIPFLKKWQKHILKIMSDEDKKLAEASDKQRKENYKQIRKEKKKVWHGKLQGQLLADVLEADFMAAV